jgi:DNA-binding beta-propeller fold protein YncE
VILKIQILLIEFYYKYYFFRSGFQAIILLILVQLFALESKAQDVIIDQKTAPDQNSYIEWIGQYPSLPGEAGERKFKDRFVEFFTGKDRRMTLSKPVSVFAVNPDTFLILDQENGQLFKIRNGVGDITQFKKGNYINFPSLVGITELPGDSILFTDSFLNKIFVISPDSKEVKSLNDSLKLEQPTGIAYSPVTEKIWVVETKAHRISILDKSGQLKKQFGERGNSPGQFNYPTSIWIDNSGKAYVIDALNFRIQIFSDNGDLIKIFGEIGDATGYFARPRGIAIDSHGNIYISDALFNAVQIFDMSGNFLYSFGKQGRENGEFWMPAGIYIDHDDNIYVADTYNSRVQVFHLTKEGNQ